MSVTQFPFSRKGSVSYLFTVAVLRLMVRLPLQGDRV